MNTHNCTTSCTLTMQKIFLCGEEKDARCCAEWLHNKCRWQTHTKCTSKCHALVHNVNTLEGAHEPLQNLNLHQRAIVHCARGGYWHTPSWKAWNHDQKWTKQRTKNPSMSALDGGNPLQISLICSLSRQDNEIHTKTRSTIFTTLRVKYWDFPTKSELKPYRIWTIPSDTAKWRLLVSRTETDDLSLWQRLVLANPTKSELQFCPWKEQANLLSFVVRQACIRISR